VREENQISADIPVVQDPRAGEMLLQIAGIFARQHLRKREIGCNAQVTDRQGAQPHDAGGEQRSAKIAVGEARGQQPVDVKGERSGREDEEERDIPELIEPEQQEQPGHQARFERDRFGVAKVQLERDEGQHVENARKAARHFHVVVVGHPFADVALDEVPHRRGCTGVDVPAERVDECRRETSDSGKRIDPEIGPGAPEQGYAEEHADHEEPEQEAAVQIGPKRHQRRKHEPPRSPQAFTVEDDAKQHRARVRRHREIDVRRRFVSGIEQASQKHGNAHRDWRCAKAETDGRENADDRRAREHCKEDEAAEARMLKRCTGERVPKPGQVEPCLGTVGERPGVVQGDAVPLPDEVAGGEVPTQIVVTKQNRPVQEVEQADERDQEQIDCRSEEERADCVGNLVQRRLVPDLVLIHRFPRNKAILTAVRPPVAGRELCR